MRLKPTVVSLVTLSLVMGVTGLVQSQVSSANEVSTATAEASTPEAIPVEATIKPRSAPAQESEIATPPIPADAEYAPGELIVVYEEDATRKEKKAARALASNDTIPAEPNIAPDTEVVELKPSTSVEKAVKKLNEQEGVAFAEPNYILTQAAISDDPGVTDGSAWGLYGPETSPANEFGSNAMNAWSNGFTGSQEVVVVVIDGGIDYEHSDLKDNIWTNEIELGWRNGT